MLTDPQRKQYQERGFVVVERAIDAPAIAALRDAAAAIVEDFDPARHRAVFTTTGDESARDDYFMNSAEAVHCFLEEGALDEHGELTCDKSRAVNKVGHALHDHNSAFTHFCRLPFFKNALQSIGYQQPALWQSMLIFKQPRIGGEVRWHQDATFLATDPSCVTGIWVALEDAHLGNGCLWAQPGGHKGPLRERYEVDPQTRQAAIRPLDDTPWPTEDTAQALEVPAGSVVFFSDHLPHYSSHNHSDASRWAFTMHVAESGARWRDTNWLQRPFLGEFLL